MALNTGDIRRWSCTKLRHFFESKSPKWMVDNLSLENVIGLEMKLRECSGQVHYKIAHILKMIKAAIASRK